MNPSHPPKIAVVGVSAIFPGSTDAAGFWHDIVVGKDLIRDVPSSHWLKEDYYDPDPSVPDKTYAFRGAFLDPIPFDPLEWGVPPSIVPATDTTQLIALMAAKRALEDATGGKWPNVDREKISCILGCTSGQELMGTMSNRLQHPVWANALRELGYPETEVEAIVARISASYVPWQESTFPGLLGNVVAGRIANRLDIGGTNCVTDAACASSFSAMAMAINELTLGQADLVLTGGVDTMNDIFMYMCFSKTPALSPSGECAPFSEGSDGTLLGEGFGMVALKRLEDAERDGDRIYAVVRAIGSSSDGRSKSVYAPVPTGQAKALRRCYEQAGYSAATVELVEAHGTGTKAGDAAEFEGLKIAFDEAGRADRQWCALGTVKSQIGHTKAAAGAAGLFKAVMALHHKVLPPTLKIDVPNPKLGVEQSPFYLNTRTRPWIRGSDHPRRASVSSFGFGGSNFHVALEEYTGPGNRALRLRTDPTELVVLSAATPEALAVEARAVAAKCDRAGWLRHVARATAEREHTGTARLAVVASDEADLKTKLGQLADRITHNPRESVILPTGSFYANGEHTGRVAFLFPGQGSQYLHMGADLAMSDDRAAARWSRAADLGLGPVPLHDVVFPPAGFVADAERKQEDALRATEWAQPAIGAASLALLDVLDAVGLKADVVGGHSYGEITALGAAGVLSKDDVLKVARKRGELMAAAAATDGAMTAVPRPIDEVRPHVAAVPGCAIANHNAPAQVVVSGPTTAIEAFEARLVAAGIEPKRLQVATAFHSPVVEGSVQPFGEFLRTIPFAAPSIPVYHNPEAAPYPADPEAIRTALGQAIARPVRFVEQIEAMWAEGVRTFVEVGPHSVLTGLVGETLANKPHTAVNLDRRKKHGMSALQLGLGRLFVTGAPLRLSALWDGYAPVEDPHTKPAPKMSLQIDGSNYGKPYPPAGGAAARAKPNVARTGFAKTQAPEPTVVEKIVEKVVEVPVPVPVAGAPAALPVAPAQAWGGPAPAVDPWLAAFHAAQKATADAHAAYQQAMADSHARFLQTLDLSLTGLAQLAGAPAPAVASTPAWAPAPAAWTPAPAFAPPPVPPAPSVVAAIAAPARPAPVPVPVSAPVPAPVAPVTPAPAGVNVEKLLLEVVAEKTGYPAEMLGMQMALEADLGVDSIKRVEILSAVRERAPGLPEVDAAEMARLQTLGQVVEHLRAALPASAAAPAAVAAPVAAGVNVEKLLLEVVAEKTGYPAEMLGMQMALEADLGVDSIKRVEILSAVRERAPGLPEVDAAEMARLQTLGQVVEHLRAALPASAAPAAVAAPIAAPAASGVNVERLLLEVVAEKTGYPADMLAMHMALEADLGVDSIKRVEILSAVRERAPGLPEVDAAEMARLQTLGQVVEHLRASLPASMASVAAAAAAVAAPVASGVNVERLLLEVVAEKTGYPADMLAMHMALESDLGVDSIKRVEILSAVRERAPGLPEVDAAEMARLQTLGQVVEHLRASLPASMAPAPAVAAPAASGVNVERLLLEVVAEKTGYPADMLAMHMALESDLGVDSIKRVEILSAVRERAPGLPEVDAAEMARLQTLGQVVEHLRASLPGGATAAPAPAAAPVAAAPAAQDPALGRWDLEVVPAPALGLSMPGLRPGAPIAVSPVSPLSHAVARALDARGFAASVGDVPAGDAEVVILTHGAGSTPPDAALRDAFLAAKSIASTFTSRGGLFVTVQDTGGDFGLSGSERATFGGLAGLAKTAAQEWPTAWCKAVDLERADRSDDDLARVLVAELLAGGAEPEVGLKADGTRIALRSVKRAVAPDAAAHPIGRDTVVVATGGARGVTAACLLALARARGGRYALLGRTPLAEESAVTRAVADEAGLKRTLLAEAQKGGAMPTPAELGRKVSAILAGREVRATLDALKAAGADARYLAVDVNDATALSAALDDVRGAWGPIGALVHGAGVLADKWIAEKSPESFDQVYGTKVHGLRSLLTATAHDPIRAIVLFSSVAGRCGNRGQVDYAMANEVLAKVAHLEARHRPDAVVKALQWGPWEGGMVTKELKARFAALGVPLIPIAAGAQWMVDELGDRRGVEVVLGGEPRMAALADEGGAGRQLVLRARVDAGSNPYLHDHVVAGAPVLPVAIALEWFARAAHALRPDLTLTELRDVKVLRGIRLDGFDGAGDWFDVTAREVTNGSGATLALTLTRPGQVAPNYSATAVLAAGPAVPPRAPPSPRHEPWSGAVYDGQVLFHGERFQVISDLELSERGAVAEVTSTAGVDWSTETWQTDPAAMDGGLQLALLWSNRVLGGASLPMGVSSMRTFHVGPPEGPLRAVLTGERRGKDKTVTDIVFLDRSGVVVNELRGVEAILRPDA